MVRLDGQPLENGSISFRPAPGNEGPSAGARITDGAYRVAHEKGVALGKNLVQIRAIKKTGRKINHYGVTEDEYIQIIPSRYNDGTELVCEVHPGENARDFDLKSQLAPSH